MCSRKLARSRIHRIWGLYFLYAEDNRRLKADCLQGIVERMSILDAEMDSQNIGPRCEAMLAEAIQSLAREVCLLPLSCAFEHLRSRL